MPVLVVVPSASAEEVTYVDALMPLLVGGASANWIDGAAYVFGGTCDGSPCTWPRATTNWIVRYDPRRDVAEDTGHRLTTGRYGHSSVWTGEHVYVFGGCCPDGVSYYNDVLRYDPQTGESKRMGAKMPRGLQETTAAWTGRYAFIFGGDTTGTCGRYCSDIVRYDPSTDTMRVMAAKMPDKIAYSTSVWTGREVVLFGGLKQTSSGWAGDDRIVRYDPAADTITIAKARLPIARYNSEAVWDGQHAFVFGGGQYRVAGGFREVLRYDPLADVVDTLKTLLPKARSSPTVWGDGSAYMLGGGEVDPDTLQGARVRTILRYSTNTAALTGLEGILDPAFAAARPEPFGGVAGCPPLPAANTLGFTTDDRARLPDGTCAPGALDEPIAPGGTAAFTVDVGDMTALAGLRDARAFDVALRTRASNADGAGLTGSVDLATVRLNGMPVGTAVGRFSEGRLTDTCFRSSLASAPCGDAIRVPATFGAPRGAPAHMGLPLLKEGANALEVTRLPTPSAAGTLDFVVEAAAIELAAPPMLLLHGWLPPGGSSYECTTGYVGDRADLADYSPTHPDYRDFRIGLRNALKAAALSTTGQDPWSYSVGRGDALIHTWSYCGTNSIAKIATQFGDRLQRLADDGYAGDVHVLAHSMGGLVARYHMEVDGGGTRHPVSRLATMGAPHLGSCLGAFSGALTAVTSVTLSTIDSDLAYEYGVSHLADFELHPLSGVMRKLNRADRSPTTDYLALSGRQSTTFTNLCEDLVKDTLFGEGLGDGFVGGTSSAFVGGHDGAASFAVEKEYCTFHFGEKGYYNDPQSRGHIAEWFMAPHAPYTASERTLDDCPAGRLGEIVVDTVEDINDYVEARTAEAVVGFALGAHTVADAAVGAYDAGSRKVEGWWDAGVRGATRLAKQTPCLCAFAPADGGDADARVVTLSGGNATISLLTAAGETRLGLELVAPDGTVIGEADALPWVLRGRAEHAVGAESVWFLLEPAAGEWRIRVRGPTDGDDLIPFRLEVAEVGSVALDASTDSAAYAPGETPVVSADVDVPEGASVAVTATISSDGGERVIALTENEEGLFVASVPIAEGGIHGARIRAEGTLADGSPFVRVVDTDFVVLRDVDWELSELDVSTTYAWRGEPVTATARVCSVGIDTPPGGATLVVSHGARVVASVPITLEAGESCVTAPVTWTAAARDATTIVAELVSVVEQTGTAPDRAEAHLSVFHGPATVSTVDATHGRSPWLVSPAVVSLAPYDGADAPFPITYSVNGGPATVYDGPIVIPDDGVHTVTYRAADPVSGETEPERNIVVRIDQTPPEPALGSARGFFLDGGEFLVATGADVRATATDATSGVADIEHRVGAGATVAGDGPFRFTGATTTRAVAVTAWDAAGHSATTEFAVLLDGAAPALLVEAARVQAPDAGVAAASDADGDGVADDAEARANSDPVDAASVPGTRDAATNGAFGDGLAEWTIEGAFTARAVDEESPLAWRLAGATRTPALPEAPPAPPVAARVAAPEMPEDPELPDAPCGVSESPAAAAACLDGAILAGTATAPGALELSGAGLSGTLRQTIAESDTNARPVLAGVTFDAYAREVGGTVGVVVTLGGPDGKIERVTAERDLVAATWQRHAIPLAAFEVEGNERPFAAVAQWRVIEVALDVMTPPTGSQGNDHADGGDVRLDNVRVHVADAPRVATRESQAALAVAAPETPPVPGLPDAPAQPEAFDVVTVDTVQVRVHESDPRLRGIGSGIARVDFLVDGEAVEAISLADGTHEIDLSGATPGDHLVSIRVVDGVGHETARTLRVLVMPPAEPTAVPLPELPA